MFVLPTFPSTQGLEVTDKGELIYGGSVAINRILELLRVNAAAPGKPRWRLWLLNVFTLVENVLAKEQTAQGLMDAFDLDCDLLTQYIEAYAATNALAYEAPVIVFYVPDYNALPKDVRRDSESEAVKLLAARYPQVVRGLPQAPTDVSQSPASQRWVVPVGGATFPHKALAHWLRALPPEVAYRADRDSGVMVTHCPLDLHLTRHIGNLQLLERFTGRVKSPHEFGDKLANTKGEAPFTPLTHRIFGDKVHLAPLVRGKTKADLLQLAVTNRWHLKTDTAILADVLATTDLKESELTRMKF